MLILIITGTSNVEVVGCPCYAEVVLRLILAVADTPLVYYDNPIFIGFCSNIILPKSSKTWHLTKVEQPSVFL